MFSAILPHFGERKQVAKVTVLVKEQNVSVILSGVNHGVLPNMISLSRMSVYKLSTKFGLDKEHTS